MSLKKLSIFVVFLLATSLTLVAQTKGPEMPSTNGRGTPVSLPISRDVLYDQTTTPGTNSLSSQDFEAGFEAYDNQAADDFEATASWTIQSIDVLGVYWNGAGPVNAVNIYFYADNAGLPGALVASELMNVPTGGLATGSFNITLNTPVVLGPGHFWLSIQADMAFAVGGQWGWTESGPQVWSESAWQNPGGGFGSPCTTWGPRVTVCAVGSAPYYDLCFRLNGIGGPVPGPGPSFDPMPANGATGVDINEDLHWSNPGRINSQEIFFGTPGNMVSVYNGPRISTFDPGTLAYNTVYNWRINNTNLVTGTTVGPIWSFTTMEDPTQVTVFEDYFADMANWTVIGPNGLTNWSVSATSNAGGVAPELRFSWSPSFTGASYILSAPISLVAGHNHQLTFKHNLDWYANPSGTIGCALTYDGGATYVPLWSVVNPTGNVGPETVTANFVAAAGESNAQIAFFYDGYTFNIDYWYIDNVVMKDMDGGVVPGYITVTAPARGAQWQAGQYYDITWDDNLTENVAILLYDGSTRVKTIVRDTESDGVYNWRVTRTLTPGSNYKILIRSKVDPTIKGWSGRFSITPMVESALMNNYPNPFNPSTVISYSIPFDGNVKLVVYNSLGQQVAELVNTQQATGSYDVTFDASSLASGIYFYQITASSVDGKTFNNVKKMLYVK